MKTLEQSIQEYQAIITEKERLKKIFLDEWETLSKERKDRLGDAITAANQSIAKLYTELLNRRIKINRVMTSSHFFYVDTEGRIADIEGNRILFRAENMSKEFGLAWLPVMCLDFAEEEQV